MFRFVYVTNEQHVGHHNPAFLNGSKGFGWQLTGIPSAMTANSVNSRVGLPPRSVDATVRHEPN